MKFVQKKYFMGYHQMYIPSGNRFAVKNIFLVSYTVTLYSGWRKMLTINDLKRTFVMI